MKFSINQSALLDALSIVQKGVSSRSALPVLSGIYVEARGDELQLQTTDLELSIQYTVSAFVEEEGAAVFPGKLIVDIVKNLPDSAVHVEVADDGAVIACESSSFSIRTLAAADFPGFPQVVPDKQISVPFDTFAPMARKVCRVVSKDESRVILTGVLITVEDGLFKMVATDSYRLAVTEAPADSAVEGFSAVLSGGFVADIAGLPRTGADLSISLSENQVIVTYADTVFVNRRIEGKYPNYKQLLPSAYDTRCIVDRMSLLGAVKRASLLEHTGSQVRMSVNVASQTIQLTTSQDAGSTQETIKAQVEGVDVEVGFNSYYLTEGLAAMESGELAFEMQGPLKPGILKGSPDENYLYLVMPVRL